MAANKTKTPASADVAEQNAEKQPQKSVDQNVVASADVAEQNAEKQPQPEQAPAAKVKEILPDKPLSQRAKEQLDKQKRVQIQIPRLPGGKNRKQYNLIVGVNTYQYSIPRGVPVMVPESVAEVIQNASTEALADNAFPQD